jgi:WD40 repeat protein
MSNIPAPIEVFYSYADADEDLRGELDKHLSLLQRQGLIATFHRRLIAPGMDWAETLDQHLNAASVILLLISADFVASDYCYGIEMQSVMERQRAGEAHVIPVLLRPVDWQSAPFGKLKAFPCNGRPVTSWPNRDEAFADIVQGIRAALGYGQRSPVPFMVEDLPKNFVQRPLEFEPLVSCLLDEKREAPIAITAALRGAGGYGKTTLARALCHDEHVQEAFDDGILWVTFGERPGNLINKIEDLIYTLSGEKPGYTSLEAATYHLAKSLADRDILLVLDDVWNSAHLNPFLQGGKRCVRLITTRNEQVILSLVPLAQCIQVDAMQQNEAIQLLISGIQGIEEQVLLNQHYDELKRLVARLGEWPLLLTFVRSVLQERINLYKQDVARAITAIHRALDKRGVTAFDHTNPVDRSQAVAKTIEVSFELLRSEERTHYQELAIFPKDADIPLQTLQHLWHLDEFDTEDLCIRLQSLFLLLHYNPVAQTVRLHDVMCTYLQHQYTPIELTQLHTRFLDTYIVKHWADLPQHEPYLWDHLATHLVAAGRTSELITTVMDGVYLVSKAHYRPISFLEQDLALAIEHDPDNPTLRHLQHSITNMAHLLHACQTWQECASVLHSRLVHLPEFQSLCQSLEHRLKRPYMTAWHALSALPMNALKRTLTGHAFLVTACAISPDGTWLLSASADGTLKIWDAASGELRHTLGDRLGWVTACAISSDGTWLLSAGVTLDVWDAASGRLCNTISTAFSYHSSVVHACAISPDGTWLLSASADHTLIIWDTPSGMPRCTLVGHTKSVNACAISPDGTWLLSASDDGTLKIWDATSGQLRHTLTGHADPVHACAISPDGTWLLSASDDGTLKIWDTMSGELRHTLTGHTNFVRTCAISPDGTWLLSASDDGTLKIWDATSGQLRYNLTGHTNFVRACAISPDGTWLLSGSFDQTLKIWEAISDERCYTLNNYNGSVNTCAVNPNGTLLLSAFTDSTLGIWETASGKLRCILTDHPAPVNAWAVNSDGSYTYTFTIWDAGSGKIRHTLDGLTNSVNACAISPDGTWLLSASQYNTLKIWDAASGELRHTLSGHTSLVTACAICPDGTWVLSASADQTLKIWDAASGELRHTLSGHTSWVTACAISLDGTWVLSASWDQTLKIWDAASGELRHTLSGHTSRVRACAISPDSTWLISASDDGTLRIWDATSGVLRYTFTGHTGLVTTCAISPDGTWLLSTSHDGALMIWNADTKTCIATFRMDYAPDSSLFCGDRYHIVAGGEGGVYFLRVVDDE